MERLVAVGLDLGTGGARAIAIDLAGATVATGRAALPPEASRVDGPRVEQDPDAWTAAARSALRELTSTLPADATIVGVSVDATSGTFLLADDRNRPLTPGIMYNDLRAAAQAPRAAEALAGVLDRYGIQIAPAFALPKIVHLLQHEPDRFARCRRLVHQTDWIVGMLCDRYDVTDISTALKTGADPGRLAWPAAMHEQLGIPRGLLPRIVAPGVPIGQVTVAAAAATGLPAGTPVISGCTDGTAGCLASGATQPGDLNITLGTTLVFKGISEQPLVDPTGAIYNHRHPAGGFLPGAASSTGAEWVAAGFANEDLDALSRRAADLLPTGRLVYPLIKTGERFPFACPTARGFGLEAIDTPAERFAAAMEAVALLERLGIERLEQLGLPATDTVYATGGGVANETWLRIRASATRRTYAVPENADCAVGAAILAASAHLGGCREAIRAMVRIARRAAPDDHLARAYDKQCDRFRDELRRRGYL